MKNRNYVAIITLLLVFFSLACTIPVYFGAPPEPEEKIVYVEITTTPKEVEEPTQEATVEKEKEEKEVDVTPTVSINLDGLWTAWYGTDEQELDFDFLQQGYDLSANAATGDGHSILLLGKVSQDGKSVSGVWENTKGTSGNFLMDMNDSLSSFSGNFGGGVPFCGTRIGSSKPYPCLN